MLKRGKNVGIIFSVLLILVVAYFVWQHYKEPTAKYLKTTNPKLQQIRQDLQKLKAELAEKGEYNCCIKNLCNWCAIYMGHCPCGEIVTVKGNEKSCPECAAAWNRKRGNIPGVDPNAIEVTTFGVYGFEKGTHHYNEDSGKDEHHEEEH